MQFLAGQVVNRIPFNSTKNDDKKHEAVYQMSMSKNPWWQGAAIYQIYPRSFFDSNGDGIGDLNGITQKLSYVADLGVDAIWISPFFKSPMKDFGYDISDYRDVDSIFGSLDDFEHLTHKAHSLGLKVMIDQVLSHTSDQHVWFQESRSSRENDKADWYVWADSVDGGEPNNWYSIFGGSAWEWDENRQQYYLHNFLKSQPDLNYHSESVREAILGEVKFWLDRGVDGFRFDAINFCYHDEQLRNNPFKPLEKRKARGFSEDNPYAAQYHIYDNNRPEMLSFLQDLRALLDQYDDIGSVGEINTENSIKSIAEYTNNRRLHMGYSFELLSEEDGPIFVRNTVEQLITHLEDGTGCWSLSNHDVVRVASRWGKQDADPRFTKMLLKMVASLPGSTCLYQGEELGLPEADISFDQLQDPFGKEFWPEFKGRDGCRTPMPWTNNAEDSAGFTTSKTPWLPVSESHLELCVDNQRSDENSNYHSAKYFLTWRKSESTLKLGDIEFLESSEALLVFTRSYGDQRLLCAFNFSDSDIVYRAPNCESSTIIDVRLNTMASAKANEITLGPYGNIFLYIS